MVCAPPIPINSYIRYNQMESLEDAHNEISWRDAVHLAVEQKLENHQDAIAREAQESKKRQITQSANFSPTLARRVVV